MAFSCGFVEFIWGEQQCEMLLRWYNRMQNLREVFEWPHADLHQCLWLRQHSSLILAPAGALLTAWEAWHQMSMWLPNMPIIKPSTSHTTQKIRETLTLIYTSQGGRDRTAQVNKTNESRPLLPRLICSKWEETPQHENDNKHIPDTINQGHYLDWFHD